MKDLAVSEGIEGAVEDERYNGLDSVQISNVVGKWHRRIAWTKKQWTYTTPFYVDADFH